VLGKLLGRDFEPGEEGSFQNSRSYSISSLELKEWLVELRRLLSEKNQVLKILTYAFGTRTPVKYCQFLNEFLKDGFYLAVDVAYTRLQHERNHKYPVDESPNTLVLRAFPNFFNPVTGLYEHKYTTPITNPVFAVQQGTRVGAEDTWGGLKWNSLGKKWMKIDGPMMGIQTLKIYLRWYVYFDY
jgi:hypothetical protein